MAETAIQPPVYSLSQIPQPVKAASRLSDCNTGSNTRILYILRLQYCNGKEAPIHELV